jgi:hypothetical protein
MTLTIVPEILIPQLYICIIKISDKKKNILIESFFFEYDKHTRGDQEGLFELVIQSLIFKCYNWSNFPLLTT